MSINENQWHTTHLYHMKLNTTVSVCVPNSIRNGLIYTYVHNKTTNIPKLITNHESYILFYEPSGPKTIECIANAKNKIPPTIATDFSDILAASILPPITANPVQKA